VSEGRNGLDRTLTCRSAEGRAIEAHRREIRHGRCCLPTAEPGRGAMLPIKAMARGLGAVSWSCD